MAPLLLAPGRIGVCWGEVVTAAELAAVIARFPGVARLGGVLHFEKQSIAVYRQTRECPIWVPPNYDGTGPTFPDTADGIAAAIRLGLRRLIAHHQDVIDRANEALDGKMMAEKS